MGDAKRAEEISVEDFLHDGRIGGAGQTISVQVNACVAHQYVEAVVPALNLLRCFCNGVLPRYVDFNGMNIVESGLLKLPDGLLTSLCTAYAQQNGMGPVDRRGQPSRWVVFVGWPRARREM